LHPGIDFAAPAGTPIIAVAAGVVAFSGARGGYGNMVEINHPGRVVTRYGHARALLVAPGQEVAQGQRIAMVGSTGTSTGPHVHFEVRQDGQPVNPGGMLARSGGTGSPQQGMAGRSPDGTAEHSLVHQNVTGGGYGRVLDLIANAESGGNYNAWYGYPNQVATDLGTMTVDQVQGLQEQLIATSGASPVGRYQINKDTLDSLVDRMGLRGNEHFTPQLQAQVGGPAIMADRATDWFPGTPANQRGPRAGTPTPRSRLRRPRRSLFTGVHWALALLVAALTFALVTHDYWLNQILTLAVFVLVMPKRWSAQPRSLDLSVRWLTTVAATVLAFALCHGVVLIALCVFLLLMPKRERGRVLHWRRADDNYDRNLRWRLLFEEPGPCDSLFARHAIHRR
jgi:hypothetical protein